jgi:polyisoprenoid-binding protein YceI
MLRTVTLACALVLGLAGIAAAEPTSRDPAKVPAGDYVLDSRHASLTMKIAHMGGFSNFAMRFDRITGGFTYDPAAWAATKVNVSIDPKSIHTGLPTFDTELAGPRYFNAERHPAITFVSTAVAADPDGKGKLTGDLSFMGVTKPVTLDVVFNGVGPGMMGAGTRLGFSGTGKIKRSDFGFEAAKAFAGDDVALDLEV